MGPGVEILAMVKADAYGHGARRVAAALRGVGCRAFGVATVAEAEEIGGELDGARVVIFGGLLAADCPRAVASGAEVVTHEALVVEALGAAAAAAGTETRVHIKVDSGMRRLGVEPERAAQLGRLLQATPGVRPVAVCSHFAKAECVNDEVTSGQLEGLAAAAAALGAAGLTLKRHLANSAAVMTRRDSHLDMVRPGLMLYGLYPDRSLHAHAKLRPVMTLDAPVMRVAEARCGDGVSYGHSYRMSRAGRIATLRCGYADGLPRSLSNRGEVLFAAGRAPVAGRVCMDHTMVDVSDLGAVAAGERAILWGPGLGAEEVAEAAGTIAYELVARIGRRVEREYVSG